MTDFQRLWILLHEDSKLRVLSQNPHGHAAYKPMPSNYGDYIIHYGESRSIYLSETTGRLASSMERETLINICIKAGEHFGIKKRE